MQTIHRFFAALILIPLCVLYGDEPYPISASPFGINSHVPDRALIEKIAEVDIAWIRCDFNWFMIEPNANQWTWAIFDTLTAAARDNGLNIFATLAYPPSWANNGGTHHDPPSRTEDWEDFVFTTVNRYKSTIKHWGMWNEPNLEHFWTGTRQQYIDSILIAGHKAAKRADSACFVIGPELAHLQSGQFDEWLRDVLTQAAGYIDIISHHCYNDDVKTIMRRLAGPTYFWEPQAVRKIIIDAGAGDKEFWLAETGWHTDEVSERVQADNYVELLDSMLATPWWHRTFFYEIRDDPNIADKWGILTSDTKPKEAYTVYKEYIQAHTVTFVHTYAEHAGGASKMQHASKYLHMRWPFRSSALQHLPFFAAFDYRGRKVTSKNCGSGCWICVPCQASLDVRQAGCE